MGLDTVETVLWAEKEFAVTISDDEAAATHTVGEFALLIHRHLLLRDGFKAAGEAAVFRRIQQFLTAEFAIPPERITRQAEFVRDLGLN